MDLNHVTLTGILEQDPITRFAPDGHGTQHVSFTIKCMEVGQAGQEFKVFIPIEAYASVADHTEGLKAGDAVMVAGKLKWTAYQGRDGQKKTSLCVLARLVKVLAPSHVQASTPA